MPRSRFDPDAAPDAVTARSQCWRVAIDTGGTFTDVVATPPGAARGGRRTLKVPSDGLLPGIVREVGRTPNSSIRIEWTIATPHGVGDGRHLTWIDATDTPRRVPLAAAVGIDGGVRLRAGAPLPRVGSVVRVETGLDAPMLALHVVTDTPLDATLPPCIARVATTRGTNALLERTGAPVILVTTRGLGDLLAIGDQTRPELFARSIAPRATPVVEVVEVDARGAADGSIVDPLTPAHLHDVVASVVAATDRVRHRDGSSRAEPAIAIVLAHAWRRSDEERAIEAALRTRLGAEVTIVRSSTIGRSPGLLARAQSAVVDATLGEVMRRFVSPLEHAIDRTGDLHVMTSAAGLAVPRAFAPRLGLLSGPAGGVLGAALVARDLEIERALAFDMGGTSTDVSRIEGPLSMRFETGVGDARILAPCVAIDTVAAGGGSICAARDGLLVVGPESAGAHPGPACHGMGGPCTITDVHLFLGHVAPERFSVPVDVDAARRAVERVHGDLLAQRGLPSSLDDVPSTARALIALADERMAHAIEALALRDGVDPTTHALLAFGGAGGLHACAIAERLGIDRIILPDHAGVLSAHGVGGAVREAFGETAPLRPLESCASELGTIVARADAEALDALAPARGRVARRLVGLRLAGQEHELVIELAPDEPVMHDRLVEHFASRFESIFGMAPPERPVELAWLRAIACELGPANDGAENVGGPASDEARRETDTTSSHSGVHEWIEASVVPRERLDPRSGGVPGPFTIADRGATTLVRAGWTAHVLVRAGARQIELRRDTKGADRGIQESTRGERVEIVTCRLEAIATQMGEQLRRTALSVNVRDRLDFSCALLDERGRLVVSAPHVPVHLGALGTCVRAVSAAIDCKRHDVVLVNHPAFGGSHLPDLTLIAPVHEEGAKPVAWLACRAHHAEIGGIRPGSMPPDATRLVQEGVVFPPTFLVRSGRSCFDDVERTLRTAPHPSRDVSANLADLAAQLAAVRLGVGRVRDLVAQLGSAGLRSAMHDVIERSAALAPEILDRLSRDPLPRTVTEHLDDGTPLRVELARDSTRDRIAVRLGGTDRAHPRNLNAPEAVVRSALVYALRLLVDRPIPLNDGLLDAVALSIDRGVLAPSFPSDPHACPAVAAGNVETSQRLVDAILRAFGIAACSQGTMNDLVFGDDRSGFYETIGGGAGATPDAPGADAVHTHMTNTRITDVERLERVHPVRVERFAVRRGSGGVGARPGGDGITRALRFLAPMRVSLLGEHRVVAPYGCAGGREGACGRATRTGPDGMVEALPGHCGFDASIGEIVTIETPGGGGWGAPADT